MIVARRHARRGASRGCATRSAAAALAGVETNLDYLRQTSLATPAFARGDGHARACSSSVVRRRATHRGARRRHADDRAGLSGPPRLLGTSACRRPGRWTRWRSASPTGWSATRRRRAGARVHADRPDACASTAPPSIALTGADMRRDARTARRSSACAPVAGAGGQTSRARGRCAAPAAAPTSPCAAASTCRPISAAAPPSRSGGSAATAAARCGRATCCTSAEQPRGDARPRVLPSALIPQLTDAWEIGVLYGPHGAPDFFTDARHRRRCSRPRGRCTTTPPHRRPADRAEAAAGRARTAARRACTRRTSTTTPTRSAPSTSPATCRSSSAPTARAWAASSARRRSSRPSCGRSASSRPATRVRFVAVSLAEARRRLADAGARRSRRLRAEPRLPRWRRRRCRASPILRDQRGGRRRRPARRHPAGRRRATCWSSTARWCSISALRFRVHALMQRARERARCPASSTSRPASARCRSTTTSRVLPREQLLAALERARGRAARASTTSRSPRASCTCRCRGTTRPRGSRSRSTCSRCAPTRPGARATSSSSAASTASTSIEDVQRIVFDASYLVLGLGDVYLGAPVATPLDPRHRLVTTKYNPARTWTPENAVGIGGAYLCVYGMEGPGRLSVRRPHAADVEPLSRRRATFERRHAVAAALLRPDPLLSR